MGFERRLQSRLFIEMKNYSSFKNTEILTFGKALLLTIVFVALTGHAAAQKTEAKNYFAHLKAEHAAAVKNYIGTQKNLRPALETDCENQTGLELMREVHGADYHPYYAVYDFDKDEIKDFAIVLFDAKAKPDARFSLVVFKGAANKIFKTAFTIPKTDLSFGGIELETLKKGVVKLRIVNFQTEQGCSVLHWRNRKLVLTECAEGEN